jgi:flagellar basal-body rod protein FlgF
MGAASLYTGMAGLQEIDARMQATASNLANVQTPGYAAVQAAYVAAPYVGANAPGGADAVAETPNPDTAQTSVQHTGDTYDVAVGGDAWLTVQTASGVALTRDGSLQLSPDGILTDSAGNPVLNTTGQPISLPSLASLQIGADGTLSGVLSSQPGSNPQSFGQINLVSTPPGALTPLSGTLLTAAPGVALTPATNGKLEQGYLNGSTVDPTQAMINMISDNRSYELQTNLMKTQSDGGQSLNTLLSQG